MLNHTMSCLVAVVGLPLSSSLGGGRGDTEKNAKQTPSLGMDLIISPSHNSALVVASAAH